MTIDILEMLLRSVAAMPLLVAALIVVATFVLEDAATVAVGLLASQMVIEPGPAVAALWVGTVAGDLGLYAAGRFAARSAWVGRVRRRGAAQRAETWLAAHADLSVAAARFIPGARLPVYTASGVLRLPAGRVAAIVVTVSAIWTPSLFWLSQRAGTAGAERLGDFAALAAAAAVAALLLIPHLIRRPVSAA